MKKNILLLLLLPTLTSCLTLFLYVALITTVFLPIIVHQPPVTPGYSAPGASPEHLYRIGPLGPSMETYGMDFEYAPQYGFAGFGSLGGPAVGTYTIRQRDGTLRNQSNILPIDNDNAFVDLDGNGTHNASFEPHIAHSLRGSGSHLFATTIATGGDADPSVNSRNFIDKGELSWNAGLLTNPASAGTFPMVTRFTSVDPDSGGANDMQGTPPTTVIKILYAYITAGATAALFTDATHYSAGHTLSASYALDNPGTATVADLYIALVLPTGGWLFVQLDPATGNATFVNGDPANNATWVPATAGLSMASGYNLASTLFFTYLITGAEPLGLYTWYIGLAHPGTTNFFIVKNSEFRVQ